ncbi:MAG: hypothetical protein HUJ76_07515 [Parasporobacterium sp.]|nr:hypothetical protein [Parasporobacterium sp.]
MKAAFIPVGAGGHILASTPMVTELVKKGVDVIYFAPENQKVRVDATGARWFNMHMDPAAGLLPGEDFLACIPLVFLTQAKDCIDDILPVLEEEKPDLLIVDQLAIAGRLASSKLGIPMIMFHSTYVANDKWSISRFWPEYPDTNPARMQAKALAEEFTEKYGIEHLDVFKIFEGHADFNIVTLARSFQPAGESFGDDYFFAGAQIAKRGGDSAWEAPTNGKPLLYTSLGSLFNNWPEFYEMLFPVVKDMDINVLCSLGNVLKPEDLGEIPANVQMMAFTPQLEVLSKCDFFLTHAGVGSVMEALHFGVPCMCIPQMDEQIMTAARMVELGVASASLLKEQVTEDTLREAITKLLNDKSFVENAKVIADEMEAAGGAPAAADKVIEYMKAHCLK